jgi:thioredoxin reductase
MNNMVKDEYELAIIGAGPAGLAAAVKAYELGVEDIILLERDSYLGGILPQCIHGGFGLKIFKKELTGPEYSQIFVEKLIKTRVRVIPGTMALSIEVSGGQKIITFAGKNNGFGKIKARAVILALGCRERTRGQIMIPGTRPAGIMTAGLAQRMVNIEGYLPGKNIVILGSGDIGLIMARRFTLEGCSVKGVFELMPFSTGLSRNISQCLEDFEIPLYLSRTVTSISGEKRVESVEVSEVDSNFKPILKTVKKIKCDTLILSVGRICENELSKTCGIELDKNTNGPIVDERLQTSVEGIFACGNSLFVNDLVDNVTSDGYMAAKSAIEYLTGKMKLNISNLPAKKFLEIKAGENVSYVIPQKIRTKSNTVFRIRAKYPVRDAVIEFANTSFKKRLNAVNPGEMVFINLESSKFKALKGNTITVNIRETRKSNVDKTLPAMT